jgi:glutathione synthase/RimK-type ligase-like ATP-grasp enzyme
MNRSVTISKRKKKRVAVVIYRDLRRLDQSEVLLMAALERNGFEAQAIPWDQRSISWPSYDIVLIRACWNYHLRPKRFLDWVRLLEVASVQTWNPTKIIRWNITKTYLADLKRRQVNIIPTYFVPKGKTVSLSNILRHHDWTQAVVKPTIGAAAYRAQRVSYSNALRFQTHLDRILKHTGAMIQPLMNEIFDGEYSFVFINGEYSHTILKRPKDGDFRVGSGSEALVEPPGDLREQAKVVLTAIDGRVLYARVDGLNVKGRLSVMEVELIEPHLSFDLFPPGADKLAHALIEITS